MGPVFAAITWLIFILIFSPFLIIGIIKKKWLYIIIGSVPIILVLLVASNIAYRICMASSGPWVYKQAFGHLPTTDVSILEKRYEFSTDYEAIYLKFKTDDVNLQELIGNRFKEISMSEFESYLMEKGPDWFNPLDNSPDFFYQSSNFNESCMSSEALLSYDKETSVVYFYSIVLY